MNRRGFLLLALAVAGCRGATTAPPVDLDDACAILDARPAWARALARAQKKWGVPVPVLMAVIWQESKYRGDARTPLTFALGVIPMGRASSAYGYAQAIDSTWKWYLADTGNRGARRDHFADAVDFMGWYFNRSAEKLGIPLTSARRQYLAYHEGHAGYRRRSWRRKPWLVRIAREVDARAAMYAGQLAACNAA